MSDEYSTHFVRVGHYKLSLKLYYFYENTFVSALAMNIASAANEQAC